MKHTRQFRAMKFLCLLWHALLDGNVTNRFHLRGKQDSNRVGSGKQDFASGASGSWRWKSFPLPMWSSQGSDVATSAWIWPKPCLEVLRWHAIKCDASIVIARVALLLLDGPCTYSDDLGDWDCGKSSFLACVLFSSLPSQHIRTSSWTYPHLLGSFLSDMMASSTCLPPWTPFVILNNFSWLYRSKFHDQRHPSTTPC
jgi:hypothetical protein